MGGLFLSDVCICACSQGALFCSAGSVDFPSNLGGNHHFMQASMIFFFSSFLNFKKKGQL